MRILHTADWHIGRTLRGRSRAEEHVEALDEIARIAGERDVDLVLVAGDVFDGSAPTAEAEEIAYRGLLSLAQSAHVVVIAGNHDHPRRLDAVRPLLDLGRVRVLAQVAAAGEGGVVDVEVGGGTARIALLPFLSQRGIVRADALMGEDAGEHVQRYADRYRRIVEALTADFAEDTVNLVVGHATVVGAKMGGGEREAHTIFEYAVPSQVFPATTHYVALGHIHRAQQIAAGCPVWYSGSPLQLDFGEAGNEGGVLVIDAEPGVPVTVERVPVTAGRRLRTMRGTLAALLAREDGSEDEFLRIVVEEAPRSGLADAVRERFPNAVEVIIAHDAMEDERETWSLESMRSSPADLFAEYLAGRKVEDPALTALFRELLEEVVAPDASGA